MKGGSNPYPWKDIVTRLMDKDPPEKNDYLEIEEGMIEQYMAPFKTHYKPPNKDKVIEAFFKARIEILERYLESVEQQTRELQADNQMLLQMATQAKQTKQGWQRTIDENERTIRAQSEEIQTRHGELLRLTGGRRGSAAPPPPPPQKKEKKLGKQFETRHNAVNKPASPAKGQPVEPVDIGAAMLRRFQEGSSAAVPRVQHEEKPQISKEQRELNELLARVEEAEERQAEVQATFDAHKHAILVYTQPFDEVKEFKQQADDLIRHQRELITRQRAKITELNDMIVEMTPTAGKKQEGPPPTSSIPPSIAPTPSMAHPPAPPPRGRAPSVGAPPPPPPPPVSAPKKAAAAPSSSTAEEKPSVSDAPRPSSSMAQIMALNPMARRRQIEDEEDAEEERAQNAAFKATLKETEKKANERREALLSDFNDIELDEAEQEELETWKEQDLTVQDKLRALETLILPEVPVEPPKRIARPLPAPPPKQNPPPRPPRMQPTREPQAAPAPEPPAPPPRVVPAAAQPAVPQVQVEAPQPAVQQEPPKPAKVDPRAARAEKLKQVREAQQKAREAAQERKAKALEERKAKAAATAEARAKLVEERKAKAAEARAKALEEKPAAAARPKAVVAKKQKAAPNPKVGPKSGPKKR